MLSRLQELKREEETLLRIKAALHDQLNRLKVEELALQSMIGSRDEVSSAEEHEGPEPEIVVQVDDEAVINQTELQLSTLGLHRQQEGEEEEEMEESDS